MILHPHVELVLPAGPDGPLVKPIEWRRWNDSKLFTTDWLDFIRPIKAWRRTRNAIRLAHWEREKQALRKWWFSLSQRERDYWKGLRADGQIDNILFSVYPKLRKYQRGSVSVWAAGTTAAAASGETLSLDSANNDAFNLDFNPPSALEAGFEVQRDGDLIRINSSGANAINTSTDWVTPRTTDVGDSYEIKWNKLSGGASAPNNESYTEDVWTTISATRKVSDSRSSVSVPHSYEFDIGDDGSSTSDVNQNYNAEAGDII